jgi:hypothetical protein
MSDGEKGGGKLWGVLCIVLMYVRVRFCPMLVSLHGGITWFPLQVCGMLSLQPLRACSHVADVFCDILSAVGSALPSPPNFTSN